MQSTMCSEMLLCPCCRQATDVAVPFQGFLVSMRGLARTLTGYWVGIKLATPAPKMCSLTTTLSSMHNCKLNAF